MKTYEVGRFKPGQVITNIHGHVYDVISVDVVNDRYRLVRIGPDVYTLSYGAVVRHKIEDVDRISWLA